MGYYSQVSILMDKESTDDFIKKLAKELPEHIKFYSNALEEGFKTFGIDETKPYRIGTYLFYPGSGLYLIIGYQNEEDRMDMEDCLDALSFSGIGGKRNAGMGRYELQPGKMPQAMLSMLQTKQASKYMLLSAALPTEEEQEEVLTNASFLLEKRSGFVASESYADREMRKKDLYVLKAGSCVEKSFNGDVYDVNSGGSHPVYRYAKPLFLGVVK